MNVLKKEGKRGVWALVSALVLAVCGGVYLSVWVDEEVQSALRVAESERLRSYEDTVGKLLGDLARANTEEEWAQLRTQGAALPRGFDATKAYVSRLGEVRTIERMAKRRDELLSNASALLSVNENDPEAKLRLGEAKQLQEEVEKLLKQVASDPKSPEWNLALEYRKAYEAYRSLAFIDKNEHAKALDITAGAVGNLAKALVFAPKDNRTERAIEFLYKRAKEEESQASTSTPDRGRPRALPPGNHEPGTGGDNRPRVH
jgi:hypothetical protein